MSYNDAQFQMKFPYWFTCLYLYKIPRINIIKTQTLIHSLYSLQVESASSEPSGHSGSPSHLHRAGTHCPFLHAKSVVAHVFFAVQKKKRKRKVSTGAYTFTQEVLVQTRVYLKSKVSSDVPAFSHVKLKWMVE